MIKRLAAFCDGTWARAPMETKERAETNVAVLYRVVRDASAGAPAQEAAYFSGVGVERTPLLGGLTGLGLQDKILEAYAWICGRYAFGDEVFLFGFSRGAYTARSLGGLIRTIGYLKAPDPRRLREAMAIYREGAGPDSRRAQAFRAKHAVAWVEPQGEARRLVENGSGRALPHAISFIGVWDTVGALGAPRDWFLSEAINRRHRFHDLALSTTVAHARHAVAADERRAAFDVAGWTNLAALNAGLAAPRYAQAWFPGDHGAVGGGSTERRLSDGALLWMAEGAAEAGLTLDLDHPELAQARRRADPIAGPLDTSGKRLLGRFSRLADRAPMGPGDVAHASALARMAALPAYRPAPLRAVWPGAAPVS